MSDFLDKGVLQIGIAARRRNSLFSNRPNRFVGKKGFVRKARLPGGTEARTSPDLPEPQ
jgi:hypothetical protein